MLRGRADSRLLGCRGNLSLSKLTVDLELDLLANQQAATAERDVPDEAPVGAVDGSGQRATDLEVAVRIGCGATVLVVERDLLGDVPDSQVTDRLEVVVAVFLDRLQGEDDRRVLLDVEAVSAFQMPVRHVRAGVDARRLHGDGAPPGRRIVRVVQVEVGRDLVEAAAHGGHAHVLRTESDRGVVGVECPRHVVYSCFSRVCPLGAPAHYGRCTALLPKVLCLVKQLTRVTLPRGELRSVPWDARTKTHDQRTGVLPGPRGNPGATGEVDDA